MKKIVRYGYKYSDETIEKAFLEGTFKTRAMALKHAKSNLVTPYEHKIEPRKVTAKIFKVTFEIEKENV